MAKITQRLVKGSTLTNTEGDANLDILIRVSTTANISNSATALINQVVIPNNSVSTAAVAMPGSPENGDWVVIRQAAGDLVTTFSISATVSGATTIASSTTDFVLDIDNRVWMFTYDSTADNWEVDIIGTVGGNA